MSNQTLVTNGAAPDADAAAMHDAQDLPARNLAEAHQALAAPFPGACIGYLPNRLGASSQWAAVFPYVDVTAIQDRLDLVVGPDRWSHEVSAIDGGDARSAGCGCTTSRTQRSARALTAGRNRPTRSSGARATSASGAT